MKKVIVGALALSMGVFANAQVFFNENFEGFTAGNLNGQNGWQTLAATGYNVVAGGGYGGSKGVSYFTAAAASNYAWPDIIPAYNSATSSNKTVRAMMDIFVGSTPAVLGRGGFRAYTAGGGTLVAGGYFRSDGNLYNGGGTVLLGTNAAWMNTWVKLEVRMNFGSANYQVFVNGTQVGANQAMTATTLEDADLFNSNSANAATISYDNYKVEAVPEPASVAALGLGVVALMRRRRA